MSSHSSRLLLVASLLTLACASPPGREEPAARAAEPAAAGVSSTAAARGQAAPAAVLPIGDVETSHADADPADAVETASLWTCPVHPEVEATEAGRCPECGMFLTKQEPEHDHGDHHDHSPGDDHAHEAEVGGDHGHEHGGHRHEH